MRELVPVLLAVALLAAPDQGLAYRPFTGTDAELVDVGCLELALGPATYILDGDDHLLELPRLKVNGGIHPRLEVGAGATHLRLLGPDGRSMLVGTKAGLKVLLRRGSRQDGSGPSLALEVEALLPEVGGEPLAGGALGLIFTQMWPGGMIHLNVLTELTRSLGFLLMGSVILEGPKRWPVRPVFEILVEYEPREDVARSVLAGLLWQPVGRLRIDAAVRVGGSGEGRSVVVTAGLTWKLPVISK